MDERSRLEKLEGQVARIVAALEHQGLLPTKRPDIVGSNILGGESSDEEKCGPHVLPVSGVYGCDKCFEEVRASVDYPIP
jgi:hypothetical protein